MEDELSCKAKDCQNVNVYSSDPGKTILPGLQVSREIGMSLHIGN